MTAVYVLGVIFSVPSFVLCLTYVKPSVFLPPAFATYLIAPELTGATATKTKTQGMPFAPQLIGSVIMIGQRLLAGFFFESSFGKEFFFNSSMGAQFL